MRYKQVMPPLRSYRTIEHSIAFVTVICLTRWSRSYLLLPALPCIFFWPLGIAFGVVRCRFLDALTFAGPEK